MEWGVGVPRSAWWKSTWSTSSGKMAPVRGTHNDARTAAALNHIMMTVSPGRAFETGRGGKGGQMEGVRIGLLLAELLSELNLSLAGDGAKLQLSQLTSIPKLRQHLLLQLLQYYLYYRSAQ